MLLNLRKEQVMYTSARAVRTRLSLLGYSHLQGAMKLPFGVSLWHKRLGFWTEDQNIHEHLCVFLQEIEGQDIAVSVSCRYMRAHKTKKVSSYLVKSASRLEREAEYLDIMDEQSWENILRAEIADKRIDPSPSLRV